MDKRRYLALLFSFFFILIGIEIILTRIVPSIHLFGPQLAINSGQNYVFSENTVESDEQLPEKVKQAFKSTIAISSEIKLKRQILFFTSDTYKSGGTGFYTESGIFISARHIFLIPMTEMEHNGLRFSFDSKGLPVSEHYDYGFFATYELNKKASDFPIELIGMGDPYSIRDMAAFKSSKTPLLLQPLELEDKVSLDEKVYVAGRVPILASDNDFQIKNNDGKIKLMDFINYVLNGNIKAIITETPGVRDGGLTKIYRIRSSPEPGFSGGPVFNRNGKVIGLTISKTSNFTYAISAEDINKFIAKLKRDGKI